MEQMAAEEWNQLKGGKKHNYSPMNCVQQVPSVSQTSRKNIKAFHVGWLRTIDAIQERTAARDGVHYCVGSQREGGLRGLSVKSLKKAVISSLARC